MIDAMIAAARTWRGLEKLVVLVQVGEHAQEVVVKLGEPRRRWKRVAAVVAPIADDVIGARGFDGAGELLGAWDAPDDDGPEEVPDAETDEMASHRSHTQWCLRETSKMYETSTRLSIELVGAAVEIVRALRATVAAPPAAPPANEDEASKTLGMLLAAVAGGGQNRTHDDGGTQEHAARGTRSNADRQGQQAEPPQAGEGPA